MSEVYSINIEQEIRGSTTSDSVMVQHRLLSQFGTFISKFDVSLSGFRAWWEVEQGTAKHWPQSDKKCGRRDNSTLLSKQTPNPKVFLTDALQISLNNSSKTFLFHVTGFVSHWTKTIKKIDKKIKFVIVDVTRDIRQSVRLYVRSIKDYSTSTLSNFISNPRLKRQ